MDTHEEPIGQLQELLGRAASPKTKEWWEKYLRYVIPFRGMGHRVGDGGRQCQAVLNSFQGEPAESKRRSM